MLYIDTNTESIVIKDKFLNCNCKFIKMECSNEYYSIGWTFASFMSILGFSWIL